MKSDYIPAPIDVSDIQLPSELCELVEIIAKNVHEVWAAGRLAEGWKYGSERNDMLRTHPGLVPYEELFGNKIFPFFFIVLSVYGKYFETIRFEFIQ